MAPGTPSKEPAEITRVHPSWRIMEAVMTKLLVPAGLLVLALAAAGCARPTEAGPPVTSIRSTEPGPSITSGVRAAPSTVAPPQSSLDRAISNWRLFISGPGGYRLRYPPGWRVKESIGSGGPVLSLLPPRGAGISVLVTSTAPPEAGTANLPNTRCQPIRVGRLGGSRCLDTISMVVSTTLQGPERWYVLTTSLRRPAAPAGAYDRVLASFRLS
jgi:hypothetical protein